MSTTDATPDPIDQDGPGAFDEDVVHHQTAAQKRGRPKAAVGQLNLTSMIDVIFQLLIYFVVTANFVINEGVITAKLPQGEGKPKQTSDLPPQRITIELLAGGDDTTVTIRWGSNTFQSFGQLTAELAGRRFDPSIGQTQGIYKPDNPIVIQPSATARWQHVVNAFNSAIAAKYTNVSFGKPRS